MIKMHNPSFKGDEFVTFRNQSASNSFNLTPKKEIDATNSLKFIECVTETVNVALPVLVELVVCNQNLLATENEATDGEILARSKVKSPKGCEHDANNKSLKKTEIKRYKA